MKTAQQNMRPFNTYPRTDSDGGRSPTGQVRTTVLTKKEVLLFFKLWFHFSFNNYKYKKKKKPQRLFDGRLKVMSKF